MLPRLQRLLLFLPLLGGLPPALSSPTFSSSTPNKQQQLPRAVDSSSTTGPCPMTRYDSEPCRDVVDSSGCWNFIIGPDGGGSADRADELWDCVPGGKAKVSWATLSLPTWTGLDWTDRS